MAKAGRPRIISLSDDREVRTYGVSAADAERIKNLFAAEAPKIVHPQPNIFEVGEAMLAIEEAQKVIDQATPKEVEQATFPFVAYGICQMGKQWWLVTVGYNPETKKASVKEVKLAGDAKFHAIAAFKIAVANGGLV